MEADSYFIIKSSDFKPFQISAVYEERDDDDRSLRYENRLESFMSVNAAAGGFLGNTIELPHTVHTESIKKETKREPEEESEEIDNYDDFT